MNNNQTSPNQPQNQVPAGDANVPPVAPGAQVPKTPSTGQIKNNIGPLIKDVFGRFYSNKKALYLVGGAFGLIFLILVVGVVFKMSKGSITKTKATPTPSSQNQDLETQNQENLSPLDKMENDLKTAKSKIDNIDVKQLLLKPPVIDYKIGF